MSPGQAGSDSSARHSTQAHFEWTVAALGAGALFAEKNPFFPAPEPTFSFSGRKTQVLVIELIWKKKNPIYIYIYIYNHCCTRKTDIATVFPTYSVNSNVFGEFELKTIVIKLMVCFAFKCFAFGRYIIKYLYFNEFWV